MKKLTTLFLVACIFCLFASPRLLAQKSTVPVEYEAEMLMTNGKNVDEEEIKIVFGDDTVTFKAKNDANTKTFKYSDIKLAEYSYSKKRRYTTGAILGLAVSVFLLPLMFTKSKKHWMTIQTEKDFVQLKLKKSNFRMVIPSFETHGVKVTNLGNENDGKDDKSDK